MTATRTTRRQSGHRARKGEGGLLREEILDATEDLLYRHGNIEAVSVRAIASRVGVSPPAIYLHFEDKDRLFYAVCRRGFDRFSAQLSPVLFSEGRAIERIMRLCQEYLRFGLENWQQYPILFGPKGQLSVPEDEIADDPGHRILNGIIALIEQAQADGDIRSDLAPEVAATLMWASVHGMVELALGSKQNPELIPIPAAEELIPALLETLVSGLAPPNSA